MIQGAYIKTIPGLGVGL